MRMEWQVLGAFMLVFSPTVFGQLTAIIDEIPSDTPHGAPLYLAGNFNGWNPGSEDHRLVQGESGEWRCTFDPPTGTIEFKVTRGHWNEVEGNEAGGFRENRRVNYAGIPLTSAFSVLSWQSADASEGTSTAGPGVKVLTQEFDIPRLNRTRAVRIYTPPGYKEGAQRYKVLYLHDGQNAFDASTSYAGEWRVDEALDSLYRLGDSGCIVVGIDNGGRHRFDEYNPYTHDAYGGGEGDAYVDFLVDVLKPWVDQHYRTWPQRDSTAIAGSSMGGLISQYAGFRESGTFSRVGVFSPAYWTADPIMEFVQVASPTIPLRVCTVVGELEGPAYVADVVEMDAQMTASGGAVEFQSTIHPDGAHSEWFWAREFPNVYQWLWANAGDLSTSPFSLSWTSEMQSVGIRPHPDLDLDAIAHMELLDMDGRSLIRTRGWTSSLPISGYGPGHRVVRMHMTNGTIWSIGLSYP